MSKTKQFSRYGNIVVLSSSVRYEGCFFLKLHQFHYPCSSCSLQPLQLKDFSFQEQDRAAILSSYDATLHCSVIGYSSLHPFNPTMLFMWPWANYFISLCFPFFICKIILTPWRVVRIKKLSICKISRT